MKCSNFRKLILCLVFVIIVAFIGVIPVLKISEVKLSEDLVE